MAEPSISFLDDTRPPGPPGGGGTSDKRNWKVLIVDDEPDVHSLTKLLLRNFNYRKRGLNFLSAYSATEARDVMRDNPDIALVLLDVVMETEHAGLALVDFIRTDLNNKSTQIVIRTGQPGQAPPLTVVSNHGINDYKEKTELTQQTMILTVVKALRLYEEFLPSYIAAAKYAQLAERAKAGADDRELLRSLRQELDASDDAAVKPAMASEPADPRLAALTEREREVLQLVARGLHAKEIARELGISPRTVEVHKARVMDKLGARNVAELVRLAVATGKDAD